MKGIYFFVFLLFLSCNEDVKQKNTHNKKQNVKNISSNKIVSKTDLFYSENSNNLSPSISHGSYSNGSLENGKLIPFSGKNFEYFSETSYLAGRAFLNDKVLKTMLEAYQELDSLYPGKIFYIMETSHKNGGKFTPHRTHQNGLSIDFMTPMIKEGKSYTDLDKTGLLHYMLEFDESGRYKKDISICIDFNLVAHHLLILDKHARKNGMKIHRVHFQNNLHDEFYQTESGKEVRKKRIVLTTGLSKIISEQHDEHYHVDFIQN